MAEQTKIDLMLRPEYGRDAARYPLRNWWQDLDLPLFPLAPGDLRWVDWLQRRSAASSWPGYMHSPLIVPYVPAVMHHPGPRMSKAEAAGLPEISQEQYKWRFYLDVFHFSPTEISLSIRDGFLEVGGKHEERPDEHGFIARCFTRKYRLPIGIDVNKITSTLSGDGILCVEAPLLQSSIPADIIIHIQVEKETTEEQGEEDIKRGDTPERDMQSDQPAAPDAPEAPETSSTEPTTEASDHGEGSPLEPPGEEAQPGSTTTAWLQQHEEGKEQEEETHGEPTEEPHPLTPADDKDMESLPEPSEQHEVWDNPESPDAAIADQTEGTEPALDGEFQPLEGSGEATEELTQPEEHELGKSPPPDDLSQELEAPDTEQDHTD